MMKNMNRGSEKSGKLVSRRVRQGAKEIIYKPMHLCVFDVIFFSDVSNANSFDIVVI